MLQAFHPIPFHRAILRDSAQTKALKFEMLDFFNVANQHMEYATYLLMLETRFLELLERVFNAPLVSNEAFQKRVRNVWNEFTKHVFKDPPTIPEQP